MFCCYEECLCRQRDRFLAFCQFQRAFRVVLHHVSDMLDGSEYLSRPSHINPFAIYGSGHAGITGIYMTVLP